MPLEPRRPLQRVELVPHGGLPLEELARRGIAPERAIDFSVSTNPLGPSPRALQALATADPGRYPDPEASALRQALARRHAVEERQVCVASGSSEALWLLAFAYLGPGDRALVLGPTYGEYRRAVALTGAEALELRAEEACDFLPDVGELERAIERERPRVVFLCNPNNPTGVWLERAVVERLAERAGEALLVVDEAYVGFVERPWNSAALLERGNVALLRSLTKEFGIPGLRLGYVLAAPEVVEALRRLAPPWSVGSAAQAAGLAALEDEAHLDAGRRATREAEAYLRRELARLGLALRPSAANFWLVRAPAAAELRQALLDEGIVVRDCASFGLPGYLRLGARPMLDCERLVRALEQLLPRLA